VRLLLDTVAWIWSVSATEKLNSQARDLLRDSHNELYFSAASAWEIAIKAALGRLNFPESPTTLVPRETAKMGLRSLPVNYIHALAVYDLPRHHGDPFDRLLIAQARVEGLSLVTANDDMQKYDVPLIWAGQ
jgi:PIN domain nuclease of toxin-antitoxin system